RDAAFAALRIRQAPGELYRPGLVTGWRLAEPLVDGGPLQGAVDHLLEGHADRLRLADAGDGRERLVHHGDPELRIDQGNQGAARLDDRTQPGALLLELLLEIHALLDIA